MLAKIYSGAIYGLDALQVSIEVSVSNGSGYRITGLSDDTIKESLSRIAIAINNSGFRMPGTKLVINLAPADVRKTGSALDFPIILGILLASEQIFDLEKLKDYWIVGEVGVDGNIYPVRGSLCTTYQARKNGFKGILVPAANTRVASLVDAIRRNSR